MATPTFERLLPDLRDSLSAPGPRPGLLFGEEELVSLRERAHAFPDLVEEVVGKARSIVDQGDLPTEPEPYYASISPLETLIASLVLEPSERVAEHTVKLLAAVADAPTWICHVHGSMRCDHCAANTASIMGRAVDALGDALPADVERRLAERTWELCVGPFLEVCRARSVFWAERDHHFNWRIMTCGETGVGALALDVPERTAAIEFALEGVADILDRVPEEGDWQEGPGYWSGTLYHGVRFALALRRATGGCVDLFTHPALRATADYFTAVTLPDGSVFNYADNAPAISPTVLHVLASQLRLGRLAWTARRMEHKTVWDMMFDDPSLDSEEPGKELLTSSFQATGIGVSRSGWDPDAVFVGFKTGPTAVGHSHLDIHSFVVQKGSTPLIIDPGIWPYGSAIGFFDSGPGGRRWDFDANATVAHNTVLVDGAGQTCGPEHAGRFVASGGDGDLSYFVSEAASAYPGLLTQFERWVVHARPDVIVVYDRLRSAQARRWQWLLHAAGKVTAERCGLTIENGDTRLSVVRLLPGPDTPWRNVEEARTTYYVDSDFLTDVERTIETHRMGPMLPSESVEFLWVLRVGKSTPGDWQLDRTDDDTFTVRGPVGVRFDVAGKTCTELT